MRQMRDCTEAAKIVHSKYISVPLPENQSKAISHSKNASTQDLIDVMFKSKVGAKIRALFDGDWSAYQSQSQADQALTNHLAFFTGKDPNMMDSLFRQSHLMRDKWDEYRGEKTYGELTINQAIKTCSDVYQPKKQKSLAANKLPVNIRDDGSKEYSTDDTGNAQRLKDQFGLMFRYSHREKIFRIWTGKRWDEDNLGIMKRMADQVIEKMVQEPVPEDRGFYGFMDWAKHLKRTKSSTGKEAMIKECQHLEGIAHMPEDLDRDPLLINLLNGTFNILTGELLPHNPEDMITKMASVIYDPTATCPIWLNFLDTVFSHDQELIDFIQQAVGYSLTGLTREQCFFILFGNGQNGKSTFIETLATVLGDYALSASPDTFMAKDRTGGANPEVVRLKGARFISTVEPQEGTKFNEGLIKQMTGNDTITARPLYAKEIQFKPVFKLWMATNHKPVIRGTDDGIWRRVKLIPFLVRVPDEKKDLDLGEKLLKESSGILNWAIQGYNIYSIMGLGTPRAVADATAEYRTEMDIIAAFIEECLVESTTDQIRTSEMYKCFQAWGSENGFRNVMNQIKFGRELNKRIPSDRSSNGKIYRGQAFSESGHRLLQTNCP